MKKLLFLSIICALFVSNYYGQAVTVKSATVETFDNILFKVWIVPKPFKYGQDIYVHYRIENRQAKPIFIVREIKTGSVRKGATIYQFRTTKPEMLIEDDTIIFPAPAILPGDESFSYSYLKIGRGVVYRGIFRISEEQYRASELWTIKVAFGYLENIKGIKPIPSPALDYLPSKALLAERMQTIELVPLKVKIINKQAR